jgi:hypothetical protein
VLRCWRSFKNIHRDFSTWRKDAYRAKGHILALVEKFLQLVERLFTSRMKIEFGGLVMLPPPFHGFVQYREVNEGGAC